MPFPQHSVHTVSDIHVQKCGTGMSLSDVFRNLKIWVPRGYISGVHFRKCSKFSIEIIFHIKF